MTRENVIQNIVQRAINNIGIYPYHVPDCRQTATTRFDIVTLSQKKASAIIEVKRFEKRRKESQTFNIKKISNLQRDTLDYRVASSVSNESPHAYFAIGTQHQSAKDRTNNDAVKVRVWVIPWLLWTQFEYIFTDEKNTLVRADDVARHFRQYELMRDDGRITGNWLFKLAHPILELTDTTERIDKNADYIFSRRFEDKE